MPPCLAVRVGAGTLAPTVPTPSAQATALKWVGTWAAAPQQVEDANLPPAPGFGDATLRQIVRVSIGGRQMRLRFSNAFGKSELTLVSVRVARSAGGSSIQKETDRPVTFRGSASVVIPAGAMVVSDALDFELPPLSNLTVTIHVRGAPAAVTGHPGSRTTSFLQAGDAAAALELTSAVRVVHWYFLSGIDVMAPADAAAVAVLGDSITDGRGSTTDGNDRWPDVLARRLHAANPAAPIAVLNLALGGNRLLRDGVGPNALARLDRDVLAQSGVRWLIVLEGVNDIGTRKAARAKGEWAPTADDIILAYDRSSSARTPTTSSSTAAPSCRSKVSPITTRRRRSRSPARQPVDPDERPVRRRDRLRCRDTRSRAALAALARGRWRRSPASIRRRLPHHGRCRRSGAVRDAPATAVAPPVAQSVTAISKPPCEPQAGLRRCATASHSVSWPGDPHRATMTRP